MPEHPFRNVAIVGVYNTRQARRLEGHNSKSITLEAVRGGLADAGLAVGDVDGLSVGAITPGATVQSESSALGYELGIESFWVGGAPIALPALLEAAAAIQSGQCSTVVIASGQANLYSDRGATAPWTRPANEFVECWGLYTACEFALVARRHMYLYGTTPEQIAFVAATIRNNGHRNPEAVYHGNGPYTAEDILQSRMVADPFHLLDCAMTAEGGSAIVLTTTGRAADRPKRAAYILGGAIETCGWAYTHPPTYELTGMIGQVAANRAFSMAQIDRADVNACEFYDGFAFEVIRQFEAYGFCKQGEGGAFASAEVIGPGGRHPVCTDGGTLSHSHTGTSQMLQKVVQCVRQVRGDSAANQIPDAHVAMCSTAGSGGMFNPVLLIGDERP